MTLVKNRFGTQGWLGELGGGVALVAFGLGHCDGVDGPVVTLARRALDAGNVNLVLPWVREQDEAEIREAFAHALAVRKLGSEARALADRHFFETLVRVHPGGRLDRQGAEGAERSHAQRAP